jgi:carbon monoxide dehydrogenase subunit G
MEMSSTRVVNAPPDVVWKALNDPEVLKDSIPGCESFTRESDTEWRSVVAAKVGPVSARFTGKVKLVDVVPPTAYTLRFEGQGGAAGFANGEAKVSLAPAEGERTALAYTAKAHVGGKLAQIGSRLVDGAAAKMADEFFTRFAERVAPPAAAVAPPMPAAEPPPRAGRSYVRYVALAAIALLLIYLSLRGFR